jgi:hexosaminidase
MLAATGAEGQSLDLIPQPVSVQLAEETFRLTPGTSISLSDPGDPELRSIAELWAEPVRRASGLPLTIGAEPASDRVSGAIVLALYEGDSTTAARPAGLFYATQTLRQLMPVEVELPARVTAAPADRHRQPVNGVEWIIQGVTIQDSPRFTYRGMHLDVSRHFFPVEFVKKFIDGLASYKMNRFHWHLTEDQGWRIEIKKYPRLTEIGAWRKETMVEKNFDPYVGDGIPYGGFYTQDEVREIVAYAAERHVTVVPEIEMPGHSTAALAAYPELACTEGPFEVSTIWGVKDDIYCPSEKTFAFLEDVLTETMELFPSEYIHIGGDEVPKRRWEESELAQEVMRREGLADEHELQSYFIRRIEAFLLSHGRRLIGWDEILEGGLAPEATVMSWRGMEGGIEAARQGHDVIMTPTDHAYFDYYQGPAEEEPLAIGGYLPLEKVYELEPVPEELTEEEGKHILGAQGNVWTEYIKTADHAEYMTFPRLLAMAEVGWTPAERKDWDDFNRRVGSHVERLDARGFNFRPLDGNDP